MNDLISRQEAIDALIACKGKDPFNRYEKQNIGLDWGIEALKQLPSTQPDSKETSSTHKALDTISRQDAIRIVDGIDTWQAGWRGDAIESMKALPSAQPETHEKRTETHACDLISRQAAVEAIENIDWYHLRDGVMVHGANSKEDEPLYKAEDVYKVLNDMPSAQPEIIRCKDCKHRDPEDKKCDCGHAILWQLPRQDDWYCADAERRTDE